MDALIGLHTRHERGLTKANLTNEVLIITQKKISEKADNVKDMSRNLQKKFKKGRTKLENLEIQFNFTKLTQMKNERNSLQQTLKKVLGGSTFID